MRRTIVAALLAVVSLTWGLTTASRVQVWRAGGPALYLEATVRSPDKPRPWVNLSAEAYRADDLATADFAARTALWLSQQPSRSSDEQIEGRAMAEANLALVYARRGQRSLAYTWASQAGARLPTSTSIQRVLRWVTPVDRLLAQ